jgi:hypothetical protein
LYQSLFEATQAWFAAIEADVESNPIPASAAKPSPQAINLRLVGPRSNTRVNIQVQG